MHVQWTQIVFSGTFTSHVEVQRLGPSKDKNETKIKFHCCSFAFCDKKSRCQFFLCTSIFQSEQNKNKLIPNNGL